MQAVYIDSKVAAMRRSSTAESRLRALSSYQRRISIQTVLTERLSSEAICLTGMPAAFISAARCRRSHNSCLFLDLGPPPSI